MVSSGFRVLSVLAIVLASAGGSVPGTAPEAPVAEGSLCPLPVDAAVSDGFRPPAEPWLPGNRGLEFATVPGQQVLAVAPGVVTFAGVVAYRWYVTVETPDGRDVTYSYLDGASATPGTVVVRGDPIGVTGIERFHLGYRDAAGYLDPSPLLSDACDLHHAVLVPVPE